MGCNSATLNAQVTFVNIAIATSALAGGAFKEFRTEPLYRLCFRIFRRFFGVGDQDGIEIEFCVILVPLWVEFWVILVALWCNSYSGLLKESPGPYIAGVFAFFDDFLELEIKTVLRSNFGSFWCLCGSNFGSFWWLSGAIPTRVHSKKFAPGPYIAGVFAVFRRFFGVGDQDGTEIEFWVILVPLWTEF